MPNLNKSLLPRSPDSSLDPDSRQLPLLSSNRKLPPSFRKTQVAAACQCCQNRKVRCDGARPICKNCKLKARICVYDVEAGLSRREDLKRKQQALQQNVDSFTALYQYLQSRDPREASSLFERIRSGSSLEDALEFVKSQENSPSSSSSSTSPGSDPSIQWSQRVQEGNLFFESELLAAASSDVTTQALQRGVECYFSYLGTMFPVFSREEVDDIIGIFLGPPYHKEDVTQDQLDQKRVACGELLAICAVGFQYDRQTLPGGDASICTPFYQKARLFLDYVMGKDPLRAMRICCCLGIYNVIAKSSLAVAYTDWGIFLGSSNGMGEGKKPPNLEEEEYAKYQKVFRALITVRSWVTATLGHIPSPEVARFIHETREEMKNTGRLDCTGQRTVIDILQQNMARITVLKANILRTAASSRTLSESTLVQMKRDLEEWQNGIPTYMNLDALVKNPEISPDQRRVTFYMHLFYMSAIMLKARAVLATQTIQCQQYRCEETRAAVADGIHAARNSARLLGLILDEGAVVKNCWLTMYQCYITYLVLSYTAIKRSLSGVPGDMYHGDMMLADRCVDILELCSSKDKIGRSFFNRLQSIRSAIEDRLSTHEDRTYQRMASEDQSQNEWYLFTPIEGTSSLHDLIDDILKMLCYPLAQKEKNDRGKFTCPPIAEVFVNGDVNLAHHLASPFNIDEQVEAVDLFPPDETLSEPYDSDDGAEIEGFVGNCVPYGWSASVFAGKVELV